MTAKKAKALRAQARDETVGLPYRTYERVLVNTKEGPMPTGMIQLGNCTRRRYKQLKQAA